MIMRHNITREVEGVKCVLMLDSKRRHRRVMYRLTKVRVFFSRRFSTDNLGAIHLKACFKSLASFIGHSRPSLHRWETWMSGRLKVMKQVKLRFCVPRNLTKENNYIQRFGPAALAFGLSAPIRVAQWVFDLPARLNRDLKPTLAMSNVGKFVENNVFASIIRKRRRSSRAKRWISGTLVDKAFWLDRVCDYLYLKKTRLSCKRMGLFSRRFGNLSFFSLKARMGWRLIRGTEEIKQKKRLPKWYL